MNDAEHRQLREVLGSYALGHLPEPEAGAVRAHLDGCAACGAELAEIAPLVDDLAHVDAARLTALVTPPPDLGGRIAAAVAQERVLVQARAALHRRRDDGRRRARSLVGVAAAVALLLGGVGIGVAVTRPDAPAPVEVLALLEVGPAAPQISSAGLVAHTWGVEVKLVGTGFAAGEVFRAAVRNDAGELLPAGEFLGTGERPLTCNLQAALLRADTAAFVVTDAAGRPVLTTEL